MPGCPFYGFRWPDRSATLPHVGGDECGLDLDNCGPCILERNGQEVNYYVCHRVTRYRRLLEPAKHLIRFELSAGQQPTLADWERRGTW